MEPETRFWQKVKKGDADECWPWMAGTAKQRGGYGRFQAGTSRDSSEVVYAHRMAWQLTNGPIPPGMSVLHHCDNPPCCNPNHLFAGTRADNITDMTVKGRHGKAKLTVEQVKEIRKLLRYGWLRTNIADHIGCTKSMVSGIADGHTWTWVPDDGDVDMAG